MRRAQHTNLRPAIAMIELIFALVIMGIAIMSAPMLISTASKSTNIALQQEGINEAVSDISTILTYPWDQNDTNDTCISPVLIVSPGTSALGENGSTGRRSGVDYNSSSHTFLCNGAKYNASNSLGIEGTIKDDIDDFTGTTLTVIPRGSGGKDYLEKASVNITMTVQYITDSATYSSSTVAYAPGTVVVGSSTNIKQITANLTSNPAGSSDHSLDTNITLKAFSCNIGGFEYAHRTMP